MERHQRTRSKALLALLFVLGCGDSGAPAPVSDDPNDSAGDGGEGNPDGADLDPQVPPADAARMAKWLDMWASEQWEKGWVCEPEPSAKTDGAGAIHVHNDANGENRVCNNARLAAARGGSEQVPKGSAALKFVGDKIYAEVKVSDDSDAGKNWYWYAPGGSPEGLGIDACLGCHSAAGADADHPGLGDYVYFQVQSNASEFDPQVPPGESAAMAVWLKTWTSEGWEREWVCEPEPTAKTAGAEAIHVHNDSTGKNRVCNNQRLAASKRSGDAEVPAGSASLKFVGDSTYVDVKVADQSDGGKGWYWYAPGGSPEGTGIEGCTGCHSAADSDALHPGLGDYVYFQVQ